MKRAAYRVLKLGAVIIVGGGALFLSDGMALNSSTSLVSSAHAVIGRPLTPLSYAGVARRTTRRAYGGAAYGAPVVAPGYAAPGGCVQVVDVYGRLVTQCY